MFRTALNRPLVRGIRLPAIIKPESYSKLKLIPPPPGGVTGGINDNLPKGDPDWFHGSYHWDYERITALSLIPLTMVPLFGALSSTSLVMPLPFAIVDSLLASTILIHSYLGLTSCIIDYIPERKFGVWHRFAKYALALGSTISLYGVYILETENNGLTNVIGKLWDDDKNDSKAYVFGRY